MTCCVRGSVRALPRRGDTNFHGDDYLDATAGAESNSSVKEKKLDVVLVRLSASRYTVRRLVLNAFIVFILGELEQRVLLCI